ncbi:MAG: manno-octulosonate cytidylyltransferase [Sphingobium sp.]|uniref:3-deoxy-manno-octulosonate cytidylyltransferase n=1 Tax=Sphingobium sp. TaxID=1912891 RepID=UPI0029A81C99|nr:manno-octulosonate cytidylyltransferase [Sphingobium sp.]MDX3908845.1 manno-octulosonate cytidylyltransferase [Sphingobium sp.]
MTTAIVIPARYASSRYPGKPLALIKGATGVAKPLVQRSIEAARQVSDVAHLFVATDDLRIADAAKECGAEVAMTPSECANGTERVAAALPALPDDADIIINFQGDALLTPPDLVTALAAHMRENPDCKVATVAVRCSATAYAHLVADQAQGRVGGTTAVCGADGNALYFSKRVLPHIAPGSPLENAPPVLLHLGLYAYRREALDHYAALPATELETIEGLEQLRFLFYGLPVAVVTADPPDWDAIELNNASDVQPIEAILTARGIV